jgi:hypothetical protein
MHGLRGIAELKAIGLGTAAAACCWRPTTIPAASTALVPVYTQCSSTAVVDAYYTS